MRLSDILSNPPSDQFVQIDGFLGDKKIGVGKQKILDIGTVGLSFFCKHCNNVNTFCAAERPHSDNEEIQQKTKEPLYCVIVNNRTVSIDAVLKCSVCKKQIPVWFLVESDGDMFTRQVNCRILKRRENFGNVATSQRFDAFGECTPLLEKANAAYREGLGAGSMVYLRKAFERVTVAAAQGAGISTKTANNRSKRFSDLLREVDTQCRIIPNEFSNDGYRPYRELSEVLHGDYDEELGLRKYEYLYRLTVGIIENIKNSRELAGALEALNRINGGQENE